MRLSAAFVLLLALGGCGRRANQEKPLPKGVSAVYSGRWRQAVTELTEALKADPRDARTYYLRGLAYRQLRDVSLAQTDLTKALELDPALSGAFYQRALARRELGDPLGALDDLDRAAATSRAGPELLLPRADLLIELGRYARARADLDAVLKAQPRQAAALRLRGALLGRLDDDKGALASYDAAVAADPGDALALLLRALTKLRSRDREAARSALADATAAVKLAPGMTRAYEARSTIHQRLYEEEEALTDLTTVINANPRAARYLLSRAMIERDLAFGRGDGAHARRAIDDATRALDLAPKLTAALTVRSNAHDFLGQSDLSRADLTAALKILPKDPAIFNGLCAHYFEEHKYAEALPSCDRAIELSPRYADAHQHRCANYMALKRLARARPDCDKSVEYDPTLADNYFWRAKVLLAQRQAAKAAADCAEYARLNPRDQAGLKECMVPWK